MQLAGDNTPAQARLQAYRVERDALLQQIKNLLERDERVSAAWLFGSLGRGDEDELSDLDVWVVVADEHLGAIATQRRQYVAQVGFPLVLVEAPQNAPTGGAYLMALYEGQEGPHPVDWYWQARSDAPYIPQQTRLLLDRLGPAPMPSDSPYCSVDRDSLSPQEPVEAIANAINFFWAMILIVAKYTARSPWEDRMGLLKWAFGPLREAQEFVGMRTPPIPDDEPPYTPDPAQKLAVLRELARQMEALMPQVAAQGVRVPSRIMPQAFRYFDLVEVIVQEKPEPREPKENALADAS